MPIFARFRKLESCFSGMASFRTFWTDCRENSRLETLLRSVKSFSAVNVRRKAQYTHIRSLKMIASPLVFSTKKCDSRPPLRYYSLKNIALSPILLAQTHPLRNIPFSKLSPYFIIITVCLNIIYPSGIKTRSFFRK